MRTIMAWTAAGAMVLAPLSGCSAAAAGLATGGGTSAAPCGPLEDDGIAYARIKPNPGALADATARAEADHAALRSAVGLGSRPPGDVIRILSWGTMLPGRTSLTAVRDPAGGWRVEKVTETALRPSKERTADAPRLSRGRIDGAAAASLDRLVSDRCLYREPTYFGRSVPTTDGGQATCADGADAVIEVAAGGRRHVAFHACHAYGRAAEASAPLWQAAE